MKICNYREVKSEPVEGTPGVTVRWVIGEGDGAPNFAMRVFEVEAGCATPYHAHDWEHEIFILEGKGAAVGKDGEIPLSVGDVIFVPANEEHQIANTPPSAGCLQFICLVPIK
ncbi:MAG: cupin domain-containing protein [Actinomycetota bacterium]|nr:cupin domain-containing protein [Actinomycetota bacterium]